MDTVQRSKSNDDAKHHEEGAPSSEHIDDGTRTDTAMYLEHGIQPIDEVTLPKGYFYSPLILGTFFVRAFPNSRPTVCPWGLNLTESLYSRRRHLALPAELVHSR